MLHTLLLGILHRVRDAFFTQIGDYSGTKDEIDALAREYGVLLGRQSERDMPKTKFSYGITGGKIMAKEYEGVMLLIATILRSTKGRRLLRSAKSGNFKEDHQIADWILMVETIMGWIQWLKSPKCK